jgi:predicted DNA-binding transcriptional regulator YafY
MKTATRPQNHRLRRILEIIRQGTRAGSRPNCGHFVRELEVSRRTIMRDLDYLRDDHNAPIAYDDSRKGFRLTDPTFRLAPVELTRREVFSFSVARKLLERFEGTPLEMDMRSVLAKIGDSLRGTVSLDVESLTDQFTVLAEDYARVEPGVWQRAGRAINQRERLGVRY